MKSKTNAILSLFALIAVILSLLTTKDVGDAAVLFIFMLNFHLFMKDRHQILDLFKKDKSDEA